MSLRDKAAVLQAEQERARRPKGTVDLTPDGAQINNVVVEGEINDDWSKVFELFNLDHTQFEVVDDTVRMSTYQQSARTKDGDRDGVQLYSYSARFRRVHTATKVDVTELLRQLRGARKPTARKTTAGRTRVVVLSDAQIGKVDERGGTKELLARIDQLLTDAENECRLIKCDDLVILDPGDLTEGFENTAGQAFTNDLSLPEQLKVARGVLTEAILRLSRLHPDGTRVATVPSNHGAWRRGKGQLGKPSDDFGLDVHRAVEEAFTLAGRDDVEFSVPDTWDESLAITVRGAIIGMVHGHQVTRPDGIRDWWAKQTHGDGKVADANILVTGHFHHLRLEPSGALNGKDRWWFQAPTLDNGSSWYRNGSGGSSGEPGLLTFTVDDAGDWDNLSLIRGQEPRNVAV